ncbi:hypothetical protein DFH94DRAFT_744244 [Russula ochroleuca]|jgi:acyl-CoA synthetase (AMP-forming)/AMP-acid ligase II|uniref:Secreted protein n=1 Tax=Russula ochroleuca TaxID=152965 RepID=A0A9P5MV66_9AGAM|nr:hypothetical protein DFH94DRAFT_744244 [Russula ochroleuca]
MQTYKPITYTALMAVLLAPLWGGAELVRTASSRPEKATSLYTVEHKNHATLQRFNTLTFLTSPPALSHVLRHPHPRPRSKHSTSRLNLIPSCLLLCG